MVPCLVSPAVVVLFPTLLQRLMLSATGSAKETFSNSELNVSDYDRNKLAVVNQV